MAEMSLPGVLLDLSQEDLQLCIIAVHILQTMLVYKSRPDIQFFALKEVLHSKGHFGFSFEPEELVRTLDVLGYVEPLESLTNLLCGAQDDSL